MGHIGGETAEHHNHHAEVAAAAHEQYFNIFKDVGCGVTRTGGAGRENFMPHNGAGDKQD